MKPIASSEGAQLWVHKIPPPIYSSPKRDWRIQYDVEDDSRSSFVEPREDEVMLIPQLRSFGACSGFLIDTCPPGHGETKLRITRRWLAFLLWVGAWLRRDAIASYVCLVCCNLQLNNSKSQAKPRIIPNSKPKTPNSDGTPSDTIFAFLMLNTMSWTHEEIFGAKFLSFERAAIVYWHTVDYAAEKRSVQWMTEQKSIIGLQ